MAPVPGALIVPSRGTREQQFEDLRMGSFELWGIDPGLVRRASPGDLGESRLPKSSVFLRSAGS